MAVIVFPATGAPFNYIHASRPPRHWCSALLMTFFVIRSVAAFTAPRRPAGWLGVSLSRQCFSSSTSTIHAARSSSSTDLSSLSPPWNDPTLKEKVAAKRRNNRARFRQHVNPLASKFQQPTLLSENWPVSSFDDCRIRPLHLDIGSAKGAFLLDLCEKETSKNGSTDLEYNYLGLEIRPAVATFAQERVAPCGFTGRLEFLGCNANVDLERLLKLYRHQYAAEDSKPLHRVTIQFPDPHFKARNAKRRVVNPALIDTLAIFMPAQAQVILQSDVQSVLDEMRERFRECDLYFTDAVDDTQKYLPENVLGVPTERELSVLKQDLPVYRSLFLRNDNEYQDEKPSINKVVL